jgi:hypothetical protein
MAMNELERVSGRRAACYFLYDLEHIQFDATLITALMGPVARVVAEMMGNYPELLDKILIVNSPPFMSALFKVFSPFIPQRTKV